ncbi:MAG TPA: hypothetical protein VGG46_01470 [Terriglobales bacterium]
MNDAPGCPEKSYCPWRAALALTLGLRVFYSGVAAIFAAVIPVNLQLMRSNAFTDTLPLPSHTFRYLFFDAWLRFDTLWYLRIARFGYDRAGSIVFYPLYPILIRLASVVGNALASALFISTLATFFLFWGLQKLLLLDFSADKVRRALLICAVWPASFIFFAGYTESLLLALILWSLYAARRDWWALAALAAFAACLTKAVGVLVLVPLVVIAWRRRSFKAWPILLAPSGSAAFLLWLRISGRGTPTDAFARYWHITFSWPWATLWTACLGLSHSFNVIVAFNLLFVFLFCWFVLVSRMDSAYKLYALAAILLFLTKHIDPPLQSTARYLLIVFPAYMGVENYFEGTQLKARFGILCMILMVANLGLMWLYLGWSLVL